MTNQNWHISKSFSIGHIVTTVCVAVSAIVYVSSLEHNININALKMDTNKELILSKEKNISLIINRIDKRLDTITNILLKQNK